MELFRPPSVVRKPDAPPGLMGARDCLGANEALALRLVAETGARDFRIVKVGVLTTTTNSNQLQGQTVKQKQQWSKIDHFATHSSSRPPRFWGLHELRAKDRIACPTGG